MFLKKGRIFEQFLAFHLRFKTFLGPANGFIWHKNRTEFPNLIFPPKRSFSSYDEPLRFLNDVNSYFKLCEQINSKSNGILPIQLAYIPFGTVNHRKEKYFLDNVLHPWWKMMQNNLTNVRGVNLVSTIFNLQKIDSNCNGSVLKFLQWREIEKIVCFALQDVRQKRFDAKQYSMLLNALINLYESNSFEKNLSKEFEIRLAQAFSEFFSSHVLRDKHYIMDNIGDILLHSAKLNFVNCPLEELENVVPLCRNIFNSNELTKTEQWLNVCHRIGSAFFIWNFNPELGFLSSYFKAIEKTFDRFKHRERFCLTVLKTCLLVGLKLSEKDFKDVSHFWKTEMNFFVQHFRRPEMDEILNLCLEMYSGNLTKIEDVLSKGVLFHLLRNTNSFTKNVYNGIESLILTDVPLDRRKKALKMDKLNYLDICDQLVAGESESISGNVLSKLPEAAISFGDEHKFVKNISIKWWQAFSLKLLELPGYHLVHPLYALRKINRNFNHNVNKRFKDLDEHPAQKIATFALKDIENKSFSSSSFCSLMDSLEELLLKSTMRPISPILIEELSNGFNSFFSSELFPQRKFANDFHKKVGEIIYRANMLSVSCPNEDILKNIILCCAENFNVQFDANDGIAVNNHLWNLERAAVTFVEWNIDADIYYPRFWNSYFNQIKLNYWKLKDRSVDSTLKQLLLRIVLTVVLKFNKFEDFELVKNFWQMEAKSHLNLFQNDDIQNIFNVAEEHGHFDQLVNMISEPIFHEFKLRVSFK